MNSSALGAFVLLMCTAAREKESRAMDGRCHPCYKATTPVSRCFSSIDSLAEEGRYRPGQTVNLNLDAEVNAKVA